MARAWQQRVTEHLAERRHAWRHGVLLLDWAERAVLHVRHRRQQSRQITSMIMHSFVPVPVPMPTQLQIMASSSALERVFSMRRFFVRCCFIPDGPAGSCCGAMVAARGTDDLWEHLKSVHGVDKGSYIVRARALQWCNGECEGRACGELGRGLGVQLVNEQNQLQNSVLDSDNSSKTGC